jgi:hypothetical protein
LEHAGVRRTAATVTTGVTDVAFGCSQFPISVPVDDDSFNPKPQATVDSGMDRPDVAPAIAFGFGLNKECANPHLSQYT